MIYADNNSTSPLSESVKEYLLKRIQDGPYANPNSIHSLGRKMNFGLEKCRSVCASSIGAKSNQIIFNSGASEGISQVYQSILLKRDDAKKVIITSGLEHAVSINAAKYYEAEYGYKLILLDTDSSGVVSTKHLAKALEENKDQVALVSLMAANNETGVIQPYKEIAKLCHEHETLFLCDTTQYIGKSLFNFEESGMDFAVVSGHKVGAIIGSGLLIAKNPNLLKPMIFGGAIQEQGLRGGTQNYIGAETLAVALSDIEKVKDDFSRVEKLRIKFEENIKAKFPEVVIIGDESKRLSSTTLISYPGIHGQAVQIELESNDIFVTTSSACSDNEPVTSKVLKSMKIDDKVGRGIIRISFCTDVTEDTYKTLEEALSNAYKKLSKIHSY